MLSRDEQQHTYSLIVMSQGHKGLFQQPFIWVECVTQCRLQQTITLTRETLTLTATIRLTAGLCVWEEQKTEVYEHARPFVLCVCLCIFAELFKFGSCVCMSVDGAYMSVCACETYNISPL